MPYIQYKTAVYLTLEPSQSLLQVFNFAFLPDKLYSGAQALPFPMVLLNRQALQNLMKLSIDRIALLDELGKGAHFSRSMSWVQVPLVAE
jgi:hypothetical protein